jgi:hypothetical protein
MPPLSIQLLSAWLLNTELNPALLFNLFSLGNTKSNLTLLIEFVSLTLFLVESLSYPPSPSMVSETDSPNPPSANPSRLPYLPTSWRRVRDNYGFAMDGFLMSSYNGPTSVTIG